MMDDDHITDPMENPVLHGHLPVSGEVGPVAYHDPVTHDTNDDVDDQDGN